MKKFIALIIVAALIAAVSVSVFAAETEEVKCTGFWSDWTHSYEITDEPLILDITHKSNGIENYVGIVAVFTTVYCDGKADPALTTPGYSEYAVIRGDSWGWNYRDGAAPRFDSTIVDENRDGDVWDDYRGIMADCEIEATFVKTSTGFKFVYDVKGANGADFVYTVKYNCNTSEGLYVFFTGEKCEFTVTPRVEEAPETEAPETEAPETDAPETEAPETEAPETEAPETDAPETDAPETDAPETDAPETEAPETEAPETEAPETEAPETDAPETEAPETNEPEDEEPGENAPQTGFITAALMIVAIGSGAYVITKKH